MESSISCFSSFVKKMTLLSDTNQDSNYIGTTQLFLDIYFTRNSHPHCTAFLIHNKHVKSWKHLQNDQDLYFQFSHSCKCVDVIILEYVYSHVYLL